ncbi:MAG: sugar phosphate isomerase/epimerase [Nitrospirae bacterium]|nr:sugar phosphate isomerase/epimerase [Nitrospirota bacterium]
MSTHRKAPRVHVHVPLPEFPKFENTLRSLGVGMELYIGSQVIDGVTENDLHDLAARFDWGGTMSIHSPFMDLSPGALDPKIGAATLERYLQVISFAEILRPDVVVFHSGYEAWKYAGKVGLWMEPSVRTWRKVMEHAEKIGVKVAVENIVDAEPDHMVQLADEVNHPLFGLCLDVGHREIFSELPVVDWARGFGRHIFELHLHDNLGAADDHMPIGEGVIDFDGLFEEVRALGIDPVYTLEAHSAEDAMVSLERVKRYL